MTSFPGSPRLLKGAIVGLDQANPLASVIVFQYNPATMTRSLSPRSADTYDDEGKKKNARSEAMRLTGPPKETISLTVEIDATDQLEKANPVAVILGIHPQLAALEMLLYPKLATVRANYVLTKAGTLEIVPMEAPLALFVWGEKRVLPVRLESMEIEEQAFDIQLNPIQAQVKLSLRVLSYSDLKYDSLGSSLFLAHQVQKELLAVTGSVSNVNSIGPGLPGL
ncbi:MAG: hypothetical protein Fur006_14560 [Coleofasciculaceae cyanobacterium]|jgi:hypothetical protein